MTNPQRILLLPMCGLGDAVCYLPFLQKLRLRYPAAEIVVIVASGAARTILESSQANAEIIVFNRGGQQRGWWPLLALLWAMRRRGFDIVISGAHPDSVRVPLFAFLCGAKVRIGANSERFSILYNLRVNVRALAHYFERYRLLLAAAGIAVPPDQYRPTLQPPLEARESAMRIWSKAGLHESQIVVGMASGADTNSRGQWKPYLKRWNNEGYAEVAKWAANELHARVVMIGSSEEAGLAADIASLSGVPIVNLCGKTGLQELQWLISKCTVFVTNDTGTMHIAGALGTPTLALFGPTSPGSFRPPGERHRIVQGRAPCSPCYPHPTCNLTKCSAMDDIQPAQVIDGISHLLKPCTNSMGPQKRSFMGRTGTERSGRRFSMDDSQGMRACGEALLQGRED